MGSEMCIRDSPVPDHVQEPVQGRGVTSITKQRLLAGLALPLVDHAELEVVHQLVLVVVDQELAGAWAQYWLQGNLGGRAS